MIGNHGVARSALSLLCAGLLLAVAGELLLMPSDLTAREHKTNKQNGRLLTWDPPRVEWPLQSLVPGQSCVLPEVLKQAAGRANVLFDSLQSFTAKENIQFQELGRLGDVVEEHAWSYSYIVLFQQSKGGLVVQDSRNDRGGRHLPATFNQDLGLTELALIFLPEMQSDYEFSCEGAAKWDGQLTWVIHFQQRKDRPARTVSFRGSHAAYPASIRGRAWIAQNSGEIQHMETGLMETLSKVDVEHWYLSINYAPVNFPVKNVRMELPQTIDAYCESEEHNRTIAYHTLSDFELFSADSTLKFDDPTAP